MTTCETATVPAGGWLPAHHCDRADYTLRWNPALLAWVLAQHGEVVDTLPGFPVSGPQVDAEAARAWADTVAGKQQWIEKPRGSGACHTHREEDEHPN